MSAAVEVLEPRFLLADGDLDPSFGVGGKVTTNFGTDAKGNSVLVQSGGEVVVAGYKFIGGTPNFADFAFARYNSNGTLNNTITTDFNGRDDSATSMASQSDGKIVVVGLHNGVYRLARYDYTLGLDASFYGGPGTDHGSLMINFNQLVGSPPSVALSDDKIIIAGSGYLLRFNGPVPDTSFDGDGRLNTPPDCTNGVAMQPDGKIVIVGRQGDFKLVRYTVDGSLDTIFGDSGIANTDFFGFEDQGSSVVVQADGKIVVAGYATSGGNRDFALARYNNDGSLDTSFDGDGKVTTDFAGSTDFATSVAVQADGRIIVAGQSDTGGGDYDFALARYNVNGSLDTSFNGDGRLTTDFGSSQDRATSVALQADGKIVVAGYTFNGSFNVFALARYTNTDEPPTFNSTPTISVQENTMVVQTLIATDPETAILTFSLAGGADQAQFSIGASSGILRFALPPDFEQPADANQDNVYVVQVGVSDGTTLVTQTISVTVTGVNDNNPATTSAATASVAENTTAVLTVTATDADLPTQTLTFSIVGGADQTRFGISSGSVLLFASHTPPPDFENPTDADGDNVYVVQVQASDGNGGTSPPQTINVTVTGVNDNLPVFTSITSLTVAEITTAVLTATATDLDQPDQTVTFSLTSGADQSQFAITSGGVLTFATAPAFKSPTDADGDNVYLVQVTASDGNGGTTTQDMTVTVAPDVRMYRAYNPIANFHFLTTSKFQFDNALLHGYNDETTGRAGFAVVGSDVQSSSPLYRLYNLQRGFHYYTLNPVERNILINLVPPPPAGQPDTRTTGWRDEGIEGYMYPTAHDGTSTIFRLYNTDSGTHLFTENMATRDAILAIADPATGRHPWQRHDDVGFAFVVSAGSALARGAAVSRAIQLAPAQSSADVAASQINLTVTHSEVQPGLIHPEVSIFSRLNFGLRQYGSSTALPTSFRPRQLSSPESRETGDTSQLVGHFWEQMGSTLPSELADLFDSR